MYLSVHATAGVLIGSYAANPPIAFLVGLASHFLLDLAPHRDGMEPARNLLDQRVRQQYVDSIVISIGLDLCLSVIIMGGLLAKNIPLFTPAITWGVIGAIAPDILQACSFLLPRVRWLTRFQTLHTLLHYTPKKPISLIAGHLTQLVTLTGLLYLII